MNRTKSVMNWINADPLRAKYWVGGCPNCRTSDLMGFVHFSSSLSAIKEVKCYGCYSVFKE